MTGAAPTVTLRQDWDYQPRLGRTKGHHASRRREQDAVVDFVARRDEGSLLVVGRRGSSKTSLVIAAVNRAARNMPPGKTLVPVPVKATSMEPNGPADKKQLLVSLIRSLRREAPAGRCAAPCACREQARPEPVRSVANEEWAPGAPGGSTHGGNPSGRPTTAPASASGADAPRSQRG